MALRTAFLSLHSHGDRSFLDDSVLAHLSGQLRQLGYDNELVVAALDGALEDPSDTEQFRQLVAALRPFDTIVYERVWSARIPEALCCALPNKTFVHLRGEHDMDDPAGRFVCDHRRAMASLLDYISGARSSLPTLTRERAGEDWRAGLSALTDAHSDDAFVPNLHPVIATPGALPEQRSFAIEGNPGCPYQSDARDNPLYADVDIPDGLGRGCAFCTTGNHYQGAAQADAIARVMTQLRYVRANAPALTTLVLRDQNPFGYLTEVLQACAAEGVGGFALLLQTRADWLLQGERRFGLALEAAARASITVSPFLVGIENFSQAELDRYNKGIEAATNVKLLAALRTWDAAHTSFDLSQASFGFILFSPWTTMADLRTNYEAIRETGLHELRGRLLLSRVRLYPDTALYYLAEKEGLLDGERRSSVAAGRYGYFPDVLWRFKDSKTELFARVAAEASERTSGRDELQLFGVLLESFEASATGADVTVEAVLQAMRPHVPRATSGAAGRRSQRDVTIDLGHGCGLGCVVCGPASGAVAAASKRAMLTGGGGRVVICGAPEGIDDVLELASVARDEGFGTVAVDVHGSRLARGGDVLCRRLRDAGVGAVIVPLFSHVSAVHDKIAASPDDLVQSVVGMRLAAAAGLRVEIRSPVLPRRLQDLPALIELAHRAVADLHAVRLYLPRFAVPLSVAPPPLSVVGEVISAALERADQLGVAAPLGVTSAVPICAVADNERGRLALRFHPRSKTKVSGCEQPEPCRGCRVAPQCTGLPTSYLRAHGAKQLRPLSRRPKDLYDQRTTPRRKWTDSQRDAARSVDLLVLRPTVHCNQDCTFCSANESSTNVWQDPATMKRAIARAARRNVTRMSFSGGEPTLVPELPTYVAIAKRCGIEEIELVSNAVLLSRPGRVAALADAGLTHAFVSLHAHDESLSASMTRKRGDFSRTLEGIRQLVDAGIITAINHVVNARNYRFADKFVELVHREFGGRVMISFAFVTPQYQALENIQVVPRLSQAMPYLLRAAWRALELGQPFVVGSRQGVPPCFLGPFQGWSDLFKLSNEAASEDSPQKQNGPQCEACAFAPQCTGLWRPYVARFGTDELVPVEVDQVPGSLAAELDRVVRKPPFGQPMSFDDVPATLRRRQLEQQGPPVIEAEAEPAPPVTVSPGQRPLRLLMVGSGRRARHLARSALSVGGLAFTAVASPHATLADRTAFQSCPAFDDVVEAIEATSPDAVIIASATPSHHGVAKLAIAAGLPLLVEKPLADSETAAEEMAVAAAERGTLLVPGHNDLFFDGLFEFLAAARSAPLSIVRRLLADAPDVPSIWSRPALYETLYHLVTIAHAHTRGAETALVTDRVQFAGEQRLTYLRAHMSAGAMSVELTWEVGTADELSVRGATSEKSIAWSRRGADITVDLGAGPRQQQRQGSDTDGMVRAFRDAIAGAQSPTDATDGVDVMRATRGLIDALAEAGAPLVDPARPKHAASRPLARKYR